MPTYIVAKSDAVRVGDRLVIVQTMSDGRVKLAVDEKPGEISGPYAELDLTPTAIQNLIVALAHAANEQHERLAARQD